MSDPQQTSDAGLIHRTDLVVALIILAGTVALYWVADDFEEPPALFSQNVAPDLFPKLLLWVIGLLALILPIEHRFAPGGRKRLDGGRTDKVSLRTYITGAMLAVVVALMPYIGTILTLVAICLLLPILWGERRLLAVLAFAVIFPSLVTLVFGVLLKVHIDPGQFGIGLY